MGTNCAPLVADLFLFCYERDFMTSLSDVKQAEIIEAFKSTSRYLDDLLNIDNPYFEVMVNRIYPPELQLNKANTSDTEAPFLDLHLSISNGFVSSKIYDKRNDFDFDIVNLPFLDGDVPRSTWGARWLSGRVSDSGARGPGSRPTSAVLCPWARHFTPRKYWLITQEAMAPSRHDWKIVDWDVKPQHNQPTNPVLPLTGFIFLNLFGLLECLVMWLISMRVIKV